MENNQQVPDSILQKVQKLQALANNPGTPAEAANAMARIQEILLKYNLDMATVEAHRPEDKADMVHERHNLNEYQTYHDGDFALKLIRAIGRFNFCQVIRNNTQRREYKKDQGDFTIVGQRHNVEIVLYMYHYCLNNIKVMANDGWKTYDRSTTKIKTVYVRHFFDGAVDAIWDRLYKEQAAAKELNATAVNAVILYNDKAVELKVKELFSNLRTVAPKTQRNTDIKVAGYKAGHSMNLSKGLGGDDNNQKRIG